MRRNRLKHFFLIIAALGLLLLGYFLGNRYQYAGLRGLPVKLLDEPVALEASLLPEKLAGQATKGRWLIVLPGKPSKACDALLAHYVEVYNRLAAYPAIQSKLHLALLDDSDAPVSTLWQHIEWAAVYKLAQDKRQPLLDKLQLNPLGTRWCQDAQATTALLSPGLMQYALLPLDEAKQIANNLQALYTHFALEGSSFW